MIHIEFIGNNGSGKTTLWNIINEHIEKVHGYDPSFKNTFKTNILSYIWLSFLSKIGTPHLKRFSKRLSAGDPRILARFINTHKEYFENTLSEICSKSKSEDHLWRLIFISQAFQFAKEYHSDKYLTFDHGFYQTAFGYYDATKPIDESKNKFITGGPIPNLVFYVVSKPETCLRRIKNRSGGITGLYKNPNLTDTDALRKLESREKTLSNFVNAIGNKVPVVEIVNEGDLESVKSLIINHLKKVI